MPGLVLKRLFHVTFPNQRGWYSQFCSNSCFEKCGFLLMWLIMLGNNLSITRTSYFLVCDSSMRSTRWTQETTPRWMEPHSNTQSMCMLPVHARTHTVQARTGFLSSPHGLWATPIHICWYNFESHFRSPSFHRYTRNWQAATLPAATSTSKLQVFLRCHIVVFTYYLTI